MKATLTIQMDNAAFEDSPGLELAWILRELSGDIKNNRPNSVFVGNVLSIKDSNGNKVGSLTIEED